MASVRRYAHTAERPEYFVPGDGIRREVIQADICLYLGNDALVRPGSYQGTQGYFVNAYRPLTTEMIIDLKNDSARWQQERQQGHGATNDRDMDTQYRQSETYRSRQYWGPSSQSSQAPVQPSQPPASAAGSGTVYASHAPSGYPPSSAYASSAGYDDRYAQQDPRADPRADPRSQAQPDYRNYTTSTPSAYSSQGSQQHSAPSQYSYYPHAQPAYTPAVTAAPRSSASAVTSRESQMDPRYATAYGQSGYRDSGGYSAVAAAPRDGAGGYAPRDAAGGYPSSGTPADGYPSRDRDPAREHGRRDPYRR